MFLLCCFFFFFNDTATTEIYTLSLHDALPICSVSDEIPGARSTWGVSDFLLDVELRGRAGGQLHEIGRAHV